MDFCLFMKIRRMWKLNKPNKFLFRFRFVSHIRKTHSRKFINLRIAERFSFNRTRSNLNQFSSILTFPTPFRLSISSLFHTLFLLTFIRDRYLYSIVRNSRETDRVATFPSLLRARVTRGKISKRDNARSVSEAAAHSASLLQALGHRKHRL